MESQKPKIAMYVKRPFGEKLNASFDFIKENWKQLFKYSTYLILPICLIQAANFSGLMGSMTDITAMQASGGISDNPLAALGPSFALNYAGVIFFSCLGALLMTSLIYAMVRLYNEREERLNGIVFGDIKSLLLRNIKRLFLMGIACSFLFIFAVIFIVLLALLALFLISNSIKMTIYARNREISIMRNVGATNGYIKVPFMLEGMIIGFIGSLIPCLITYFGYRYLFDVMGGQIFSNMFSLQPVMPFTLEICAILIVAGMLVGLFGSFFSTTKYLHWKR